MWVSTMRARWAMSRARSPWGSGGAVPAWGRVGRERRIRLAEARRAARAVGARLTWLGLTDPGVTRTGEEALEQWDRWAAIEQLVTAARTLASRVVDWCGSR